MFPPPEILSHSQLLLITDELPSPADFLLHRILASQLRENAPGKAIILSVSEDLARWKAIAAKSVRRMSHITLY
jgi:hypothetical protein